MEITIKNCKNIDNGRVTIEPGKLNIKYAINGTGKSSIAQAIDYKVNNKNLTDLLPYKYTNESPLTENHTPEISISDPINSVSIFNESYLQQYIFQSSELVSNSFEVFVKTPDYDEQLRQIQELMHAIQETFRNNPNLETLITDLGTFISGFGKAQNGYSKTGTLGKGLAKGNKVEHIPTDLLQYKPYIQSDKNAKWLSWQSNGEEYLDYADKCPYCAKELSQEAKTTVKQVAIEYDSKYITELQKTLSVFRALDPYFAEETRNKIEELSNKSTAFTDMEIVYLKGIKEQIDSLYKCLVTIRNFSFSTLKDVGTIVAKFTENKIDIELLPHINSEHTRLCIDQINQSLDDVISNAGNLQGKINIHKRHIADTIRKYSNEINGFLQSAGYKYCVDIIDSNGSDDYKMILKYKETNNQITEVTEHLSYGERNAFALVLFMYRTIKENPDLIVLDDPISSFDDTKKYAIMEKLFKGGNSLQGKTVVMLTHDFDPVVDLIHTSSIRCRFCPCPVASFLYNKNGELHEKNILSTDIKSFIEIAKYNIENATDEINKMIFLRRYYEVCGAKHMGWQLLSNVFHPNRATPTIQITDIDKHDMTEEEIAEGTRIICEFLPDFEYNRVYARAHDLNQMLDLYQATTSDYEKVQIYRLVNHGDIADSVFKKFVDEVYHIENDRLFQLNPSDFPTIPYYIIELCNNKMSMLALPREE